MDNVVRSEGASDTNDNRNEKPLHGSSPWIRLWNAGQKRSEIKASDIQIIRGEGPYEKNRTKLLIENVLSSPQHRAPQSRSEEIEALSDLIRSVLEAAENNILSEQEARTITRHAVSNFLGKRVEEMMGDLFSPRKTNKWLFAASRHFHESN